MDDDDDLFDDADLQEIEQHALAATQRPKSTSHEPAPRVDDFDSGFDDADVIDLDAGSPEPLASRTSLVRNEPRHLTLQTSRPLPHPQSTARTVVNSAWRRNDMPTRSSQALAPAQQPEVVKALPPVPYGYAPTEDPAVALQARVAELEAEHTRLQQAVADAESLMYAKAGEISIVRTNHDRAAREYERRIALMQKTHAEEVARQKAELESAKKSVEKSETDKNFLQHDLRLAQEQRKRAAKDAQAPVQRDALLATPKKGNKNLSFRDGFDDDEVMMVSPTKSRERRKREAATPQGRAKRKRIDMQNSPTKPLSFIQTLHESGEDLGHMDVDEGFTGDVANMTLRPKENPAQNNPFEQRFTFMRFVLDHKPWSLDERTLERLMKHEYPLDPSTTVASRIYDFFATFTDHDADVLQFQMRCCERIIEVWTQCFEHKNYAPLKDMATLLQDILAEAPTALATSLVPTIVTLCFNAADYMALRAIRAHMDPKRHEAPSPTLCAQLDSLDYLDLSDIVALNCYSFKQDSPESLRLFWSAVPPETVLMLLNKIQPLDQIHSLLSLLASSILPDSFGARVTAGALDDQESRGRQIKNEDALLKRLTVLLFETPVSADPTQPYTSQEVLALRFAIFNFLNRLCVDTHGGHSMASHTLVIGRLARFIHECVVTMYAYYEATHAMTVGLLNRAVKLLHYLTTKHKASFDLRQKLAAVPGGTHMHLVALSKIAFAEGQSVIERGIEPEVAEFAHDMLDDHLSPDEGDAVIQVFSSATSRRE